MRCPVLGSRRPSDSGASLWGQRSSNTTQLLWQQGKKHRKGQRKGVKGAHTAGGQQPAKPRELRVCRGCWCMQETQPRSFPARGPAGLAAAAVAQHPHNSGAPSGAAGKHPATADACSLGWHALELTCRSCVSSKHARANHRACSSAGGHILWWQLTSQPPGHLPLPSLQMTMCIPSSCVAVGRPSCNWLTMTTGYQAWCQLNDPEPWCCCCCSCLGCFVGVVGVAVVPGCSRVSRLAAAAWGSTWCTFLLLPVQLHLDEPACNQVRW